MRNRDRVIKVNESASESILPLGVNSKYTDDVVSSQISLNAKGEYDAIEGYEKLLPWFRQQGDQEAIDIINEIIADEKNHLILLSSLLKKYDKINAKKD